MAPHRGLIIIAVIAMVFEAATTTAQAWLMQPALDKVFLEKDRTMLVLVPAALIAVVMIKAAATYCQELWLSRLGQTIVATLQKDLYSKLIRNDLGYLRFRGPGALMSHLVNDVNRLRAGVSNGMTGFARDGLTVVFLLGLMFYQDWQLAMVAAIGFPIAFIPIGRLGKRMRKLSLRGQEGEGLLTARLERSFSAARQIKADNQEDAETKSLGTLIDSLLKIAVKSASVRAIASPSVEFVAGLSVAAIVLYGGWQVIAGTTTPGGFFSFITAMLLAYTPLKRIARLATVLQEGFAAGSRLFEVLDREPSITEPSAPKELGRAKGRVSFENVNFSYDNKPALHDVSLNIEPGKTVAIVGPSGSGKSTLLDLLFRFFDPASGRILIDGIDISSLSFRSLRSQLGLVSQDILLFDNTVAANIAFARPDSTQAEIEQAAKIAAIHDVIMELEQGYDTKIGAGGIQLSGGQKQRLSIARALLKNAPVMVFDEATSALDPRTEEQIRLALRDHLKGRTNIIVTHRIATTKTVDQIAVFEEGRIVQIGSPEELSVQKGLYFGLQQSSLSP